MEVRKYTWEELLQKAIEENKDSLFIQIIKEKPMYPKDYADHDVKEFGQKIRPTENAPEWVRDFEFGYIMGYMRPSVKPNRPTGWYEVCFPSVTFRGNPTEYVLGMDEAEIAEFN